MSRFALFVLGTQNSGKSTGWYTLFGGKVHTSKAPRRLAVDGDCILDVFLINGSCEERGVPIQKVLGGLLPDCILASLQFVDIGKNDISPRDTVGYLLDNQYAIEVIWLNPGFKDSRTLDDEFGLIAWLEDQGIQVHTIPGKSHEDVAKRVGLIRSIVKRRAGKQN